MCNPTAIYRRVHLDGSHGAPTRRGEANVRAQAKRKASPKKLVAAPRLIPKTGMETPKIGILVQTQHLESMELVTQQVHCGAMEIHCASADYAASRCSISGFRLIPKTDVAGGEMVQDAELIWFEEGLSVLN